MPEKISFIPKEEVNLINIFDISKAKVIISCIYGQDSSPKITNNLINQGNKDFACLSGGIYGLAYHLNDDKLIIQTNGPTYNQEIGKNIFKQTGKNPSDYYKDLKEKTLIIITHGLLSNVENTYSGQTLLHKFGVKKIITFREERYFKGNL